MVKLTTTINTVLQLVNGWASLRGPTITIILLNSFNINEPDSHTLTERETGLDNLNSHALTELSSLAITWYEVE
jgi:hypothetical protein